MRIFWVLLSFGILMGMFTPLQAQVSKEDELAERYFRDGEFESALEVYQKLYRKSPKESYVLKVVSCQEILEQYDDAKKFLDKNIRKYPEKVIYPIVKAQLLEKTGELKSADKLYEETLNKKLRAEGDFIQVGAHLYQAGKLDLARRAYEQGRKRLKSAEIFANEIANIYRQQGEYEKATSEYLNEYFGSQSNFDKVKLDILNMVGPPSQNAIERELLRAQDKRPGDEGLRIIAYEFYVLAENFREAFLQVKAIDRIFREDGHRVFEFARTMRNNKRYELSNQAYDYLIREKKSASQFHYASHQEKAINSELRAFENLPVDQQAIREAVENYDELLKVFGRGAESFDAIYRQARLRVFYLFELDPALKALQDIVKTRIPRDEWAKAKLLIGDILLMQQQYKDAQLTYTEITEQFKDRQTGALAKYKLAQLSYFKGEFSLSQALLGAIKDNTSNDISNDAIKLNLTIMDNSGLDTTTKPLEIFAQAQLLVYQRNFDEAMTKLDSLAYAYPNHALSDEILWEKANIFLKRNNLPKALEYIDRVLDNFRYDILADDALYTKARIYDYSLNDPESAMKYYLEFLSSFPGSLYSVEVRKRIRELRKEG
ncbi:MAG: tetratricopeptide repeat protein [Bacteroidota bacterium]